MKIITETLSNFFKTLRLIRRIERDDISYPELIEYLYGETPPENNDFLRYDYTPHIAKIIKYERASENQPTFSVIIATYNRRELLLKNLNSVTGQNNISPAEFEVVIIDNGSKDKTEEAVRHFANQNGRVNIIYIKLKRNYGADFARNVGVLNSGGHLLAFTDDDCIVPPDWLSEFKRELDADPEIAGVGGFKTPRSTRGRLDIYHRFLMWEHFLSPHVRTKYPSVLYNRCGLTANVCYRRDAFEKAGGFNFYFKHVGFEEFKICLNKLDLVLLYEPRMVEHFAYFTFGAHVLKLFPQSLDRYLLHKLHPDVWPNPSFLYFLKRTIRDIHEVFTSGKQPPLFNKSLLDIIGFSFLSIITNFCLWLGKYWFVAFG